MPTYEVLLSCLHERLGSMLSEGEGGGSINATEGDSVAEVPQKLLTEF